MIREWLPRVKWWRRRTARQRLGQEIGLWYHPDYAPRGLATTARVPNLQLDRAERVIGQLAAEGLIGPGGVDVPNAISVRLLERFHPAAYLRESVAPDFVARVFGLPPEAVDVDELVRAARLAAGGTMAAARFVRAQGPGTIGINLGGGFHHAQPEKGSGFCIYNDVAVAIAELRAHGFDGPVAIVDLDYHQGDGNLIGFSRDPTVLTYALFGASWATVEAVADVSVRMPGGTTDAAYLERLGETLPMALAQHRPRMLFFLAGTDVLRQDKLGDFALTPDGVLARDRMVVNLAREIGVPLVITLAGGYSEESAACTANLVRWLLTGDPRTLPSASIDVGQRFAQIFEEIDPVRLQMSSAVDLSFSEQELLSDLGQGPRPRRLVLDYYSKQGVEFALQRYGILDKIRDQGFSGLRVDVDPGDPARQTVRVTGQHASRPGVHLLLELVARRQWISVPGWSRDPDSVEVLRVEWLLLQDPTANFSLHRPQLPGQRFPGLGVARDMIELFVQICHRLSLAGVLNRPSHFHTAAFFAERFHFLDPELEGRLDAVRRVLGNTDSAEASWRVERGELALADGTALAWEPGDHLLPVSESLRAHFEREAYQRARARARAALLASGLWLPPSVSGPFRTQT